MISNINIDKYNLTKADMYTIIRQTEEQNTKLRELALAFSDCRNTTCEDCIRWNYSEGECSLDKVMRELGIKMDSWTKSK